MYTQMIDMKHIYLLILIFLGWNCMAQDDLLAELDSAQTEGSYATASFKGLQIVTLQSTKLPAKKEFYMVVSHRFGTVKDGFSEFFGLDNATTKLGFIYGLTDWLSLSASRHTLLKVYEGSVKYRIIRQSDNFPVELLGYHTIGINSLYQKDDYPKIEFTDRLDYTTELLASRKFTDKLSFQLISAYIHKNLYNPQIENNNQFALGAGGRMKISKRLSLNLEYMYNFDQPDFYTNPLSVGLDIETGGHVFQLLFTNSQPMTESGYLTNAAGDWGDGDFFFGFNLYRVF